MLYDMLHGYHMQPNPLVRQNSISPSSNPSISTACSPGISNLQPLGLLPFTFLILLLPLRPLLILLVRPATSLRARRTRRCRPIAGSCGTRHGSIRRGCGCVRGRAVDARCGRGFLCVSRKPVCSFAPAKGVQEIGMREWEGERRTNKPS